MPEYSPRHYDTCVHALESGEAKPEFSGQEAANLLRELAALRKRIKQRASADELKDLDQSLLRFAQSLAGPMIYPMGDDIGIDNL